MKKKKKVETEDQREERVYGSGKGTITMKKADYSRPMRAGSARNEYYKRAMQMVKGDCAVINGIPRVIRANWYGMCKKTGIDPTQFKTLAGDGCLEIYKVV